MKYHVLIILLLVCLFIFLSYKKTDEWNDDKSYRKFQIDVIITWLDTSDEKWWKRYREEQQRMSPNEVFKHETPVDEKEVHYPLFLNVMLIKKHMPWVRNIYIFCQRPQRPNWLSDNFNNVYVVYHDEIKIPSDISPPSLPTYNGMVTCSLTSHIPNLSEHYIQADDDVFVLSPLFPSFFFTDDGKPIIRGDFENMDKKRMKLLLGRLAGENGGYSYISENTMNMLENSYKKSNMSDYIDTNHSLTPCVKSLVLECKRSISSERWNSLRSIRSKADFDFYGLYLVPWLVYEKRDSLVLLDNKGVQFIEGDYFEKENVRNETVILCVNNSFKDNTKDYLERVLYS